MNAKVDDKMAQKVIDEEESSPVPENMTELAPQHREYLLQRHGTLELDPVPAMDDADPYNWASWKKVINLFLVAFHAMFGTFTAAAIIPAYLEISLDLGISINTTSYLTSLQIAILGGAPLFWKPLSNRFGRRPIFLVSLLGSLVCNIGCAKSPTYASMAACRALVAFFISPAGALGSAVVMECFFKRDRARYMGVWTLLVTLGVPVSPFIFGFVAQRVSYRWIYWVLAIVNGVQFFLCVFFQPETKYIGHRDGPVASGFRQEYLSFRRIDPTPFNVYEFIKPLTMVTRPTVIIPAAAYAMVFLFASVMCTVEIPQLLELKFGLDAQSLGLQFLSLIIGSVLGEQLGGPLSDSWMRWKARQNGQHPRAEHRLWLSYIGFLLAIAGVVVFLVQTQNSPAGHWNVTPVVGVAIAAFGNQVVTTVLITYAVDTNHTEAASVGVLITFVRQIWGFIGPFWFPDMFANVGVANSAGVAAALMVGASLLPTMLLQWRGHTWRRTEKVVVGDV
ncbi:MFS multidrug transporter, putative [Talaromyces stipitatus ATCC 10500]|uniref:MFS multidrug transporter, putative n=1 Tax=Talaromyces stipitatus (strain ATCC 10500 / CBS 375.48 / QM 6759 / NRRL 1006) TaxID=441959 RepID=B8MPH3_TALSN|nr:MFS multidrug transporter, putative [Talaromyces stipitatus ATCC 10500]EED14412.1 MFS multidrug transporter, putative [Talaromyces stipitatus ATCC 10500]